MTLPSLKWKFSKRLFNGEFIISKWFLSYNYLVLEMMLFFDTLKNKKWIARFNHSFAFKWCMWLTPVVKIFVSLCYLICLGILFFLDGACIVIMLDLVLVWFPPFISLSSTSVCAVPIKKSHQHLNFFSFHI